MRRRNRERYTTNKDYRDNKIEAMRAYYGRNAERERERARANYEALDSLAYAKRLLQKRRRKALKRREARRG